MELAIGNTGHNFSGGQYSMTDMIVKYIPQCDVCRFKTKSRSAFDALKVFIPDVHAFGLSGNVRIAAQHPAIRITLPGEYNIHGS
jgi:hypothetical protein